MKKYLKEHYELDELQNASQHGCGCACLSGLIYYSETCSVYEQFKDQIWDWLYETAEDQGYPHCNALIASFNGSKDVSSDEQYKNLIVWAFVESVAFEIVEEAESEGRT